MSQTYQPKKKKRARTHGYLARTATKNGKTYSFAAAAKDERNSLYKKFIVDSL